MKSRSNILKVLAYESGLIPKKKRIESTDKYWGKYHSFWLYRSGATRIRNSYTRKYDLYEKKE